MQGYLRSETLNLSINEKRFIFAARTRMMDVKSNFKSGQTGVKCRKCGLEEETQQLLLNCPALADSSLVDGIPRYDDLFGAKPSTIGRLLKHKGKRKDAASELGISERTLYRKLKEFGL